MEGGLIYTGSADLLIVQLVGIGSLAGWSIGKLLRSISHVSSYRRCHVAVSLVIFTALRFTVGLKLPFDDQIMVSMPFGARLNSLTGTSRGWTIHIITGQHTLNSTTSQFEPWTLQRSESQSGWRNRTGRRSVQDWDRMFHEERQAKCQARARSTLYNNKLT